MAVTISVDDLTAFGDISSAQAQIMIDDALAVAATIAPCITSADFPADKAAAAKAIIRRAILRWAESGVSGAVTQQSAGPYSQSVTQSGSKGLFLPSEMDALRDLCKPGSSGGAFTIKPAYGGCAGNHADICSLVWGDPCSCGSNINRFEEPLYEGGLLS